MSVRLAKTQISLGIRPVWSESLLCAQWVAKGPRFLHVDSEDSDQTGIWVFAGHTLILLVLSCRGSNVWILSWNSIVYVRWQSSLILPKFHDHSIMYVSDHINVFRHYKYGPDCIVRYNDRSLRTSTVWFNCPLSMPIPPHFIYVYISMQSFHCATSSAFLFNALVMNYFPYTSYRHNSCEPRHEKTCLREFPTRSDSNWPATLHYLGSGQQRRWSDCADAQADLCLCCSHMT